MSVFTPDGEHIQHIGERKGNGKIKGAGGKQRHNEGELYKPHAVAIDFDNVVYVCEWDNHLISVFTQDGEFIRYFGREGKEPGEFKSPASIAIDNNGKVYISDSGNDRVQVFQQTSHCTP